MKNYLLAALAFSLGVWVIHARADVYQCATDNGSVTLSNVEKGQNCKKMILPPPESKKTASTRTDASPKITPGIDSKSVDKPKSNYDSAAAERKRIIQEEMELEKVRLNAVQARIKELAAVPNKTPDQVKDLISLQQKENLHSSNLQVLQKELNK